MRELDSLEKSDSTKMFNPEEYDILYGWPPVFFLQWPQFFMQAELTHTPAAIRHQRFRPRSAAATEAGV